MFARTIYKPCLILIVTLAALSAADSLAIAPSAIDRTIHGDGGNPGINPAPEPISVDRITHNAGNIVTTVDNYGLIGGYSHYDLPSGEWPRNSDHNYIGELKYWMGCVTAGDSLVSDTDDDFQAVPMPVDGSNQYRIYLSTDTTRYWDYDPTDSVGSLNDNPALGWRIYDGSTDSYVYNQNYDPLATAYNDGGPTSLQESHYRFGDIATGSSLLGLELTQTILQWNYCYNEDFMFVKLEITNTSLNDYADFAFGLYVDLDVGGEDGTGENGRLGDMVGYDIGENLGWMYDLDGIDAGWGPGTGVMGTKLLKTPQDIGMTAFRSGEWELFGQLDDPDKYQVLNSAQFDNQTQTADWLYLQCTRGINLTAGETIEVVYAIIAGADEEEFRENAARAQSLYDANYVGPQPPPTPTLTARASDEKVYLSWNNLSENGLDPLSGENDFAGYKLYRSDNQGRTWGEIDTKNDNNCLDLDYKPVALYSVENAGDPIPHSYVDRDLYNGVDYWYCLVAFDKGDTIAAIDPLQSGFGIAGEAINIVSSTPRNDPAGLITAAASVEHEYTGPYAISEGDVLPEIFDYDATLGAEYQVSFTESPAATYWNLVNLTSGDTVLVDQAQMGGDPELYDLAEGIRVYVTDGDIWPLGYGQTSFATGDTSLAISTFWGSLLPWWTGSDLHYFGHGKYRATYELRPTTDSTLAPSMWEYFDATVYPKTPVPFEAWNVTTGQRVSLAMDEWPIDETWSPGDGLAIVDYPYNPATDLTAEAFPYYYGWRFDIDAATYNPSSGDVLTIDRAPLNGPGDLFTFKIDGVNAAQASANLKNIRVVPNPYFAQYSAMVETGEGEAVIEFQKVPDECTIRIYTLSGDLVKTIYHSSSEGGTARWDLKSKDQIQVSSGIYLFHVESPYGEHLGRFAVIK